MSSADLFPLSEEHAMIRQAARDFAQNEIAPVAAEFDETGEFPVKTIRKMGEIGLMGVEVPEEYGGAGVGAAPLPEPMSGSDAGTMRSRAVREGDQYVINGRKSWVTSAPVAEYIVVFTMTAPEKKQRGITAFIVETDKPGFAVGKKDPKLGIRASATSALVFEDYSIS